MIEFLIDLVKRNIIDNIAVGDDYQVSVYEHDTIIYVRLSDLPISVRNEYLKWSHWVSGPGPISLCEQYGECIYPKDFIKLSGGRYLKQEAPFDIVVGEPIHISHDHDKYQLLSEYLDDQEYGTLQQALLENPQMGDLMPGTGGFRKARWKDPKRGKGKRWYVSFLISFHH